MNTDKLDKLYVYTHTHACVFLFLIGSGRQSEWWWSYLDCCMSTHLVIHHRKVNNIDSANKHTDVDQETPCGSVPEHLSSTQTAWKTPLGAPETNNPSEVGLGVSVKKRWFQWHYVRSKTDINKFLLFMRFFFFWLALVRCTVCWLCPRALSLLSLSFLALTFWFVRERHKCYEVIGFIWLLQTTGRAF